VEELDSKELVNAVRSLQNINDITWVHFEGRIPDVLHIAIPQIRKVIPQATISIEFEKPDRPGLNDLLPLPDVAFFSHTYLLHSRHAMPESLFTWIRLKNPTAALIVTLGPIGAYYATVDEQGQVSAPLVDVVDATGAGDTFIAGAVWALGKMKMSLAESVGVAVNLASGKVSQEGFEEVWSNSDKYRGLKV
jgi:ketohexokinase